jgi:hypothetical protein
MSQPNSWHCTSVEKFFQNFHWQGSSEQSSLVLNSEQASLKQTPWQCLTVSQFFQKYNWQGLSELEIATGEACGTSTSVWLQSVRDFLRSIDWDGNPEIGALPELEATPANLPMPEPETTLDNFKQLF